MPRVSIILTCFNHVKYLPACYQGILDQTFTDYEIIAIDDGSTDGSREWLSALHKVANLTVIFNERNLGTYATLNVGLARASGEFIAILNDDDLWAPGKLAEQIGLLDSHPRVGLVHTNGHFIDGEGRRMEGSPLGWRFPRFETGDVLLGLVYQNKIIASAALARSLCFAELGGFNDSYFGSGDWEMWFRIAEKWDVGFVADPLTFYRVHGANASHQLERIWRDDEKLREWMAPRLETMGGRFSPALVKAAMAHNYAALGTVKTLNGDPSGARRAFFRSIELMPWRVKSYLRYAATFLPHRLFRKLL